MSFEQIILAATIFFALHASGALPKIVSRLTGGRPLPRAANQNRREVYEGTPRIVDGDTVVLNGRRVRLVYIDAPELGQPTQHPLFDGESQDAGAIAKAALVKMIGTRTVTATVVGKDRYDRDVARLSVPRGDKAYNLGYNLGYFGFAMSSCDAPQAYKDAERDARRQRRGLWGQGGFADPASHRRQYAKAA